MKDYYRILEISPSASFEVIKASYRALAKKYHPDTQASSNMEKTMADINEAYETLSNSQSRKEYDQQYSRFINSTKSCEKKVSENDAGSQLNKTTTSEKSSNEPDSRHGFFSFVKKSAVRSLKIIPRRVSGVTEKSKMHIFVLKGFLMTD